MTRPLTMGNHCLRFDVICIGLQVHDRKEGTIVQ